MLTDEQDSSKKKQWIQLNKLNSTAWKKGNAHGRTSFKLFRSNPIQRDGRKEMLTDEQTSSWKKAMNSIQ